MFEETWHIATHGMDCGWLASTGIRVVTGSFFAISGYHKLFNRDRHEALVETLKSLHIPSINLMQWWVPGVEFAGGLGMVFGLFGPVAALGLLVIMGVALCTDGCRRVDAYKPIDACDRVDDWEYLPETLYAVMLLLTILGGSGPVSLDHLLWG